MMRWRTLCFGIGLWLAASLLAPLPAGAASGRNRLSAPERKAALTAMKKASRWLIGQQEQGGSWRQYPAITALAATALMRGPERYTEKSSPAVAKAVRYIVKQAKPGGAIYSRDLPTYNTAICLMALKATRNPAYQALIRKGQRYLMGQQLVEANGHSPSDMNYGGISYGGDQNKNPDLSNLQMALTALKETGVPKSSPVWERAIRFVSRCQNLKETNDQSWAGDDGGFIYSPAESKAGERRSYASMTYAGLLSMIYVDVDRNDPRVRAAVKWISRNYTLEENAGMENGKEGLYYYYHTLSKTFTAYGQPVVIDASGIRHNWYRDLTKKLLSMQKPEGFWVNDTPRWWENDPVLVTSYALMALQTAW
ncbi:MAG: terpene cyclase/mutase family protein [Armatimonadetes bacterium]|nr:terpene cyclase/mutase family protein [Armatimonadota bacterium]